jgi:hypothetical protein
VTELLSLRDLQQGLREVIQGRSVGRAHPYLVAVASSERLEVVQETIAWWRALSIERSAPLTSALLQECGLFDEVLASIVDDVSPFHCDLRSQFLAVAAQHPDRLVAALAEFEEAAIANPSKSTAELIATINWPCDPYPVLSRLVESPRTRVRQV